MNRLNGTSVYLTGAIEHHEDPRKWRRNIANNLLKPMGIKVYDPLVKPSWMSKEAKENPIVYRSVVKDATLWDSASLTKLWNGMSEVRDIDLRMAHSCDFMICSLPKKFTVGTLEELSIAASSKKPILIHAPDGIDISTWLPVQISSSIVDFKQNCIFENWDRLYNYIIDVDNNMKKVDNLRWIFLSYFEDPDTKENL